MTARAMTEILTAVALVVMVIAIVVMILAIVDSIEKLGDEVRDYLKGGDQTMSAEKRYRCIKEFSVPLCNEDGCAVESGEMDTVEVGETFYRSTVTWMNDVRLEGVGNTYGWLETSEETFREHFEEVSE